MFEPFKPLRLTADPVCAPANSLALWPDGVRPADGTEQGKLVFSAVWWPVIGNNTNDLWNDIAGPLDNHRIANADVLTIDLVLIVQCGVGDDDTANCDRFKPCHRGQRTGAPHLHVDRADHGLSLFGGKLMRQRHQDNRNGKVGALRPGAC